MVAAELHIPNPHTKQLRTALAAVLALVVVVLPNMVAPLFTTAAVMEESSAVVEVLAITPMAVTVATLVAVEPVVTAIRVMSAKAEKV